MITKENYIGIDGILKRLNTVPRFVCDGFMFFTARRKVIDTSLLEKFMAVKHPGKYDENKSIKENVEAIWGKDLSEQIEYHLKNELDEANARLEKGMGIRLDSVGGEK